MNKLTKEGYEKALTFALDNFNLLDKSSLWDCISLGDYGVEMIIKEHFSNHRLSWKEVTDMIGRPVLYKNEWYLIWKTDYYQSGNKRIWLVGRRANVIEIEYMEGCLYTKEVKENVNTTDKKEMV